MCGIAGIFHFDGRPVDPARLRTLTDALTHRGPDGEGHWFDGNLGLGHRRLSILDLSAAGAQPMHSADGRFCITFNGEIYNYRELREEMKRSGFVFRSNSDTEVLLELLAKRGVDALSDLDGMFAFALWDKRERTLTCARDRFGEKPFFYWKDKASLFFASELKALRRAGAPASVNERRVFSYLAYKAIEDPFERSSTFFESIRQLEPGETMLVERDGELRKKKYWELRLPEVPSPLSLTETAERYRELFATSLKRRLHSDVTVGTCLSGGLDSSGIVCTLVKFRDTENFSQKTFSARMRDPQLDEGRFIEKVVQHTSVDSHSIWIDDTIAADELDTMLRFQDEPVLSTAVLSHWFVMKLARENNVTVLIDGQGPDEVLAGYDGYAEIFFRDLYLNNPKLLADELGSYRAMRGVEFPAGLRFKLECRFSRLLSLAASLRRKLVTHPDLRDLHPERISASRSIPPPFQRWTELNHALRHSTTRAGLPFLLRMCDRNSMAFSREVRLPFLYHELVEFCFAQPAHYKIHQGWTKYLLRKAFEPVLPPEITWRRDKKGFATPQDSWLASGPLHERLRHSIEYLKKENWISAPSPEKSWQYLSTAAWLETS